MSRPSQTPWILPRKRESLSAVRLFGVLAVGLVIVACGESPKPEGVARPGSPAPPEFTAGEAKFTANCLSCHGQEGKGTPQGPPLVHKIYEPNHHGDEAFQRAAANGVRAHHWQFGDMPKVATVAPADVAEIIQYVRWLQRQAGIR
ncbi:MAG: cytochrome c [Nitrospira sp.]|nr:MAG: cytochrome c [Nitrospira sp.]